MRRARTKTQKTQCTKCSYQWFYNGTLPRATCPSCGYKTLLKSELETYLQTPNQKEEDEDTISNMIRDYLQTP